MMTEYDLGYMDGFKAREALVVKEQPLLRIGPVAYDRARDQIFVHGKMVHLSRHKRIIMAALLTGRLVRIEHLLGLLYPLGDNLGEPSRCLAVQICNLRKELTRAGVPPGYIQNEWGVGYIVRRDELVH